MTCYNAHGVPKFHPNDVGEKGGKREIFHGPLEFENLFNIIFNRDYKFI